MISMPPSVERTTPVRPIPAEEIPLAKNSRGFFPSRFATIFGVVTIAATVIALILAAGGPLLVNHVSSDVPAGWTSVYDATPNDPASWRAQEGCNITAQGLDARGDQNQDGCGFVPSQENDLLSQGFILKATLAPDGSLKGYQAPFIAIKGGSDEVYVVFEQSGAYTVCINDCLRNTLNFTSAWHTDGFTTNSIAVEYRPGSDAQGSRIVVYANGQQIEAVAADISGNPTLVFGALREVDGIYGEALFTHLTLYSASGSSSSSGS
ncbi:MAG: hypothetical protein OJF49_004609 [Ktedonobacterales bacterium]|jgi:hypothetical protein|nr:MAG: hypothetical protein OJF49_004609 [Ktedonobacterales bacterium]